jgi:hypothetical protein
VISRRCCGAFSSHDMTLRFNELLKQTFFQFYTSPSPPALLKSPGIFHIDGKRADEVTVIPWFNKFFFDLMLLSWSLKSTRPLWDAYTLCKKPCSCNCQNRQINLQADPTSEFEPFADARNVW